MLRENDFDKHFEKASAVVGLPVALFKSICAVESGFDPYFNREINSALPGCHCGSQNKWQDWSRRSGIAEDQSRRI
jgi:hypothetical protein